MLINFVILYSLLFIFLNFANIQGVPTNDEEVEEYKKSINSPKHKNHFKFVVSTDELMWKDASLACKKKGMTLACLDTLEKHKQFLAALDKHIDYISDGDSGPLNLPSQTYWIGGFRDNNNLATFQWENGNFINSYGWARGEPSYSPYEYCLESKVQLVHLGWNDVPCDKLNQYICMYDDLEEETKNTKRINKDTQGQETHFEENKNLENFLKEDTKLRPGWNFRDFRRGYVSVAKTYPRLLPYDPIYDTLEPN